MEFDLTRRCCCEPTSAGVHAVNCPMSWPIPTAAAAPAWYPMLPPPTPSVSFSFGPPRISDEDVDLIAKRVVELLKER